MLHVLHGRKLAGLKFLRIPLLLCEAEQELEQNLLVIIDNGFWQCKQFIYVFMPQSRFESLGGCQRINCPGGGMVDTSVLEADVERRESSSLS